MSLFCLTIQLVLLIMMQRAGRLSDSRRLLLGLYRFLANCNSNRVMAYGHR